MSAASSHTDAIETTGSGASRRGMHRALEIGCLAMLYAVPLTVTWTVAGVHIALGLAAACALALGILARRWLLSRTPADAAFAALVLTTLLSALFAHEAASDPRPLKKLLLIPSVHLAATVLASGQRSRTALRLFVFAAAATALVTSFVFLAFTQIEGLRLRSNTHYMTWSGLLLLAFPMAVAGWLAPTGRRRWAYAVATLCMSLALLLTETRSAWLGAAVTTCIVLVRLRPRLLWAVPVVALVVLLVAPAHYRARVFETFDPSHHSTSNRIQAWATGLDMWRERPWTGAGLGDLQPLYREHAPDAQKVFGHLHNNWFQILASLGILGLAAFAWLMVRCGQIFWRAQRVTRAHPELHALALGAWGSFWGFQIMGLVEWNFGDVEVMIMLYFLLGAVVAATKWSASDARS